MSEPSALPTVSVEAIKNALRIDGNDDDTLIQGYIDTAQDYIKGSVVSDEKFDLSANRKYRLAVLLLVQFWYSNRTTDIKQTPYQVRSLIQQLRGEIWS